jgi:hypothetical protein
MHSKLADVPITYHDGLVTSHSVEWGEMNVAFESDKAGMDTTLLFKGLPGDSCSCPHWGYLLKGKMRVKYADHEEIIAAGEVYYLAPGHIVVAEEDCEEVEFSPKGEFRLTMELAMRNIAALQKGV